MQSHFAMQSDDIYNNSRLIFHALGPKFDLAQHEGIDPSVSITAMEIGLGDFMAKNPNMPAQMQNRLVNVQKSLARAKTNYLICIGLVKLADEPSSVGKMALELAREADSLAQTESHPSILFVGGHYLYSKEGSLGGHTATYDVMRQADGKLCFTLINTLKAENDKSESDLLQEEVYSNLNTTDLDEDFWKNVIKLNYMNPFKGKFLMEAFYTYLDKKLNKGSNKTVGRSFRRQVKGVCGWKSISVWLHGKVAPCKNILDRIEHDELVYLGYKRGMFERMQASFRPDASLDLQSAQILITELGKKIQKMNNLLK
ncbi:MAG: hypothetical protein AMXMBFR12_06720 [Candidatus Babeliales bacterium]